jgi:hypothetical protein
MALAESILEPVVQHGGAHVQEAGSVAQLQRICCALAMRHEMILSSALSTKVVQVYRARHRGARTGLFVDAGSLGEVGPRSLC